MIDINNEMFTGINNSYVRHANKEDVLTFLRIKIMVVLKSNNSKEMTDYLETEIKFCPNHIDREDIKDHLVVINNKIILIVKDSKKNHTEVFQNKKEEVKFMIRGFQESLKRFSQRITDMAAFKISNKLYRATIILSRCHKNNPLLIII